MRDLGLRRKKYLPDYPQEEFVVPLIRSAVDRLIDEFSSSITGKKVIDIGAGSQPFREELEKRGGKYHSLEVEQHFKTQTDFTGAIDGELSEELLASGPYDFILCTEVLEHVADWDKAFINFHKLLSRGGILVATAPFFYPLHEVPFDYWRPTPFSFKFFSEKHGLVLERCDKLGGFFDVLGTLFAHHISVRPLKRNFINRFQNKIIHVYIKYSLKLLKSGDLHQKFDIRNPFYHSAAVVVSKQ